MSGWLSSGRVLALALAGLAAACPAGAAIISVTPAAPLGVTPDTITLGGGAASFAFTADASVGGADVATGGTGKVTSFFGAVTDFASGSTIDGTGLYGFSAFPSPSAIPNSAADDFIGLSYAQADGVHYGYAEVAGPELVSYGYETSPGTTILTGAAAAVPEPASLAALGAGLLAMAGLRGRKRA